MRNIQDCPKDFSGWRFVSENRRWKHFGEMVIVNNRNAIDSSYWDCIALDGSSPGITEDKLREMFRDGKLLPPADRHK